MVEWGATEDRIARWKERMAQELFDEEKVFSAFYAEVKLCPRCKCEMEWVECWNCGGEGVDGHDCGEDCCCCLDPEENVRCDICKGRGGWYACISRCDEEGKHGV
ncbi:MAG: hypothetical protein PHS17_16450 [Desulfobacterales bacterium]|nr:hypothetical protein [Desulfobacterales bacterium]